MGFSRLLIANRGEIAVRIQRAARELGMTTIQVHSAADADSLAVKMADKAVNIGPPHAAKSYLNISAILDAAAATGAEAIHPGYGFLSENAGLRRCGGGRRPRILSAPRARRSAQWATRPPRAPPPRRPACPWCRARRAASAISPRRARSAPGSAIP